MIESEHLSPAPVEVVLPWGSVVRGLRWGGGPDSLLLLHEPGADLDAWGSLPPYLAGRLPLDVTSCDLPGHGLSDDPWEPERLPELVLALAENEGGGHRRFVLAAGGVASVVLALAGDLRLAGVIVLSPPAPDASRLRSPRVPKLIFAGSLAGEELRDARRMATSSGGWAVVTSVPVAASGTGLLATDWAPRIADQIGVFLRDCLTRSSDTEGTARKRSTGTR